jgi:hypothetical protein
MSGNCSGQLIPTYKRSRTAGRVPAQFPHPLNLIWNIAHIARLFTMPVQVKARRDLGLSLAWCSSLTAGRSPAVLDLRYSHLFRVVWPRWLAHTPLVSFCTGTSYNYSPIAWAVLWILYSLLFWILRSLQTIMCQESEGPHANIKIRRRTHYWAASV